jgi:hypothetical protein
MLSFLILSCATEPQYNDFLWDPTIPIENITNNQDVNIDFSVVGHIYSRYEVSNISAYFIYEGLTNQIEAIYSGGSGSYFNNYYGLPSLGKYSFYMLALMKNGIEKKSEILSVNVIGTISLYFNYPFSYYASNEAMTNDTTNMIISGQAGPIEYFNNYQYFDKIIVLLNGATNVAEGLNFWSNNMALSIGTNLIEVFAEASNRKASISSTFTVIRNL